MSAVVKVELPSELVAIRPEAVAKAQALVAQAHGLTPRCADDLVTANALFVAVKALADEIANQRLELTRPIDALKAKVIEAERSVTEPLMAAKEALGKRMLACKAELDRVAAEERRKAEEEARRRADEERQRLKAERQAIIAQQQAEHEARVREAEAARAKREAEAQEEAALFGLPAPEVSTVEVVPEAPPEPPPVVVVPEIIQAPTVTAAPKLAVRQVVRKVVKITDEAALLAAICAGGGKLHGRQAVTIDAKAVEALLRAGCAVVGAELVDEPGMAAAGKRGVA